MKISDLEGKAFVVINANPNRVLLEEYDPQYWSNKFYLLVPKPGHESRPEDASITIEELKRTELK